jgi:hypothetical protein
MPTEVLRIGVLGEQQMSKYEQGDFIKVEFPDEATGTGEWMWLRVHNCDDAHQIVFGILDSTPVNDYSGKLKWGTELAISFAQIRERKKAWEFERKNLTVDGMIGDTFQHVPQISLGI